MEEAIDMICFNKTSLDVTISLQEQKISPSFNDQA